MIKISYIYIIINIVSMFASGVGYCGVNSNNSLIHRKEFSEPEKIVKTYNELDTQGAWLTGQGRSSLNKLTNWIVSEELSSVIEIISSWKVIGTKLEGNRAVAEVEYYSVGFVSHFAEFEEKRGVYRRNIELVKDDNGWKINTQLYPTMHTNIVIRELTKKMILAKGKGGISTLR